MGDGERRGTRGAAAPLVAPYGSWGSPIEVELVAGTAVGLAEPWLDGDDAYWLESRPSEGGRKTLLRHGLDGRTAELTPLPFRVGNRVHEYGGGSYAVDGGRVVVSSQADGRLYRLDPEAVTDAVAITPEGPWRYADLWFDPRFPRLYAVRETHDADHPDDPALVVNELVALALDGSDGPGRVLVSGPDFVAGARPSPDGRTLAWMEWDLPDMPWDAVRLRAAEVLDDGSLGECPHRGRRPGHQRDPGRVEPGRRPARRVGRDGLVEPLRLRRPGRDRGRGPQSCAHGRRAWRSGLGLRAVVVRLRSRRLHPRRRAP